MNKLIFAKDDLKEPTDEYLVIDKWYEKLLEARGTEKFAQGIHRI